MNQRDRLAWVVIILSVALLAGLRWQRGTAGSDFPERGITLVVPYAAGGGTDLLSRNLARAAEPLFGRTVTVNNITGGVGAVGFTAGLLAPPDGYTVTAVTFELVSLPLQGLVPFTHEDFDLLMRTNMDPAALTVGADFPADTLEEFLALARTRETPLSLGNSGFGSVWHLAGALFAQTTDITGRFIPYSGAAPAITALVGGHVDAVTVSLGEVRPHVLAGQLKVLGVMSESRLDLFPDVPTFRERGIDVVFGTWRGLALPRDTPAATREILFRTFRAALEDPGFVAAARTAGFNLAFADGGEFRRMAEQQSREIAALMTSLGMNP